MPETFLEALKARVLLGDGAMGTQLQQAGLEPGGCGESWNVDEPEKVETIQRRYVDAGSDCLITNTFGACRIMLERHGRAADTAAINRAGAEIARRAFGDRPGFVIGDIGPFGGLLEPYGEVQASRVEEAFAEQAEALVAGGVDAIIIETQTALEELSIGIAAAKKAGARCVIGSMAYDVTTDKTRLCTMMGIAPTEAAKFMKEAGADVVALNCGSGVDVGWAAHAVREYLQTVDLPTMAQPNAGMPVLENLKVVYKQSPEEMGNEIPELIGAGARVVGGCCGSTPDHIRYLRRMIDGAGK